MCVRKSIPRYFGLFPLWPVLVGVLTGVCLADTYGTCICLLAVITCLVLVAISRHRPVYLLTAGFLLSYGSHATSIERQRQGILAMEKQPVLHGTFIKAVIIDTGKQGHGPYLMKVLESDHLPTHSRLLLAAPERSSHAFQHGDIISASGRLTRAMPPRNPHGFNRAAWLHRLGADLVFHTREQPTVSGVNWQYAPVRVMSGWRHQIRKMITAGIPPESKQAQLIRAVVLGERPPGNSAIIQDFRNSGTLHVFAVSGLHVGMVGVIFSTLLWFLRAPRCIIVLVVILSMTVYAGITGMNAPAVRAVIMAAIYLSGFLVQRRPSLLNSLAASAIVVLVFDGHQLFTPGFQLSYGVLLTIALATGFWIRVLKPIGEIDPFLPRPLLSSWQEFSLGKRRWLRGSLAVSMAAWIGSAPLMWLHFGIITPIAIIAGIPLMLIVFLILALAILSVFLGSLWQPAGEAINTINSKCASAAYSSAATFAKVPGGHYYQTPKNDGTHSIIVFDLPYGGGAQYLNMGGGIILDCGRNDAFPRHVMPTLTALRTEPDSLIVTHADSKHSGAMTQCLEYFDIKQALIPKTGLRSPSYKKFLTNADFLACRLIIPAKGQRLPIENGVYLETLHAPSDLDGRGRADDTGLVLRLHCHGWRILFTGDAGYLTEERLLASGINLDADIIVMGRNRDDYTGSPSFLKAVQPKAIISTNAPFPEFETIPASWKIRLQSQGIHLFDQSQTGAVTLTIDKKSLTLTPTLKGVAPLSLKQE